MRIFFSCTNIKLICFLMFAFANSITRAELVVIVHPDNANELSQSDIANIYLGKKKVYADGVPIVPFHQSSKSPAYNEFIQSVVGKSVSQYKSYWSRLLFTGNGHPARDVGSGATVKTAVAIEPAAIGYIDSTLLDSTVKAVYP